MGACVDLTALELAAGLCDDFARQAAQLLRARVEFCLRGNYE
jgi:hypothetical protein